MHSIKLIEHNEINVAFTKANADLLSKHKVNDTDMLINLWSKEYNATLNLPDTLMFSSSKSLTLFLLKWS